MEEIPSRVLEIVLTSFIIGKRKKPAIWLAGFCGVMELLVITMINLIGVNWTNSHDFIDFDDAHNIIINIFK